MTIDNRTTTSNDNEQAAFGVTLDADGTLKIFAKGSFDAGYADRIASKLVLLATKIRCVTRAKLYPL